MDNPSPINTPLKIKLLQNLNKLVYFKYKQNIEFSCSFWSLAAEQLKNFD